MRKRNFKALIYLLGTLGGPIVAALLSWALPDPTVLSLMGPLLVLSILLLVFSVILHLKRALGAADALVHILVAGGMGCGLAAGTIMVVNAESREQSAAVPIDMIDTLAGGIKNDLFSVTPLPEGELIVGQRGHYYMVDLLLADAQETLWFSEGDYTVDAFDRTFAASFATFVREVIRPLGDRNYALYVRGSADRDLGNDFRREQGEMHFGAVEYLRHSSGTRFSPPAATRFIPTVYSNDDLPYLRAAFIRDRLSLPVYRIDEPFIVLEGAVEPFVEDERLRNATIYLFVE